MSEGFKVAAVVAFIFAALLTVGALTNWFGLIAGRPMAKYAEETRAQVYDESRQYNQGTNRDIARYCRDMRSTTGAGAKATAALILTTADTFGGELNQSNTECVAEAKAL